MLFIMLSVIALVRRIEHTSGSDVNGLCELVEDGGRGFVSRATVFKLNSVDDVSHVHFF